MAVKCSLLIMYGMGRNLMLSKVRVSFDASFSSQIYLCTGKQFPKLAWGMTGIFTNIRFRVLEVKTWEQTQKNTASSSRAVQHLSMPCNLR